MANKDTMTGSLKMESTDARRFSLTIMALYRDGFSVQGSIGGIWHDGKDESGLVNPMIRAQLQDFFLKADDNERSRSILLLFLFLSSHDAALYRM